MMYRELTLLTSVLLVGLGLAMIVVTALHGGGVGIVLGVLFVAAGAGRFYITGRRRA